MSNICVTFCDACNMYVEHAIKQKYGRPLCGQNMPINNTILCKTCGNRIQHNCSQICNAKKNIPDCDQSFNSYCDQSLTCPKKPCCQKVIIIREGTTNGT